MNSALVVNIILMGVVLVAIVWMHHWAIRTQHHDPHFHSDSERPQAAAYARLEAEDEITADGIVID